MVHLPVDVLTRLAERSDPELEEGLAGLIGSGAALPAGLRALVDRPHLALDSGSPWRVLGVALRRAAPRKHSTEELLSREAFAFWHAGTYWLNTALPAQALERWTEHLDRIEARIAELLAEQSAGLALLDEARGLFSSTLKTDARLNDPRKSLADQHLLVGLASQLAAAHRHEVEAAAKALAQETRRRRKPKEAVARLAWSRELGGLFDALKRLGEGVKVG